MTFTKILGFMTPIILQIFEKIAGKLSKEQEGTKDTAGKPTKEQEGTKDTAGKPTKEQEGTKDIAEKPTKEQEGTKDTAGKPTLVQEKEYGYISFGLIIVCGIYSFVNIFTNGPIFSALLWLQDHWWIAGIYILLAAVLPSITAYREYRKETFWAQEDYAVNNCMFNLLGVAASYAAFGLVYCVVTDFSYLKFFYIEDLIPVIAAVSTWMAIIYQKIESRKDKAGRADHDTSLKHLNQKLNLLHLFNVYFLAIASVVYLVSYTIYCRTYHIDIVIHPRAYYILISVALCFFYKLSQHKHRYLYILSIIFIPVILISSVYWMTWLTLSQEMRREQWIFVFIHSMLYMLCVFRKEKVICLERCHDKEKCRGIRFGGWKLQFENSFLLVLPIVVAIIFFIVWTLPSYVDRLPANEAYNYIAMICKNTDVNANEIIQEAEKQDIYNAPDGTYDIEAFMKFLSEELGEQLLEMGLIEKEGDVPTRDALNTRLVNSPWFIE